MTDFLLSLNQYHIYEKLKKIKPELQKKLSKQIMDLDRSYPGGLAAYVKKAKQLLQDAKTGINPFEGFVPEIPQGFSLTEINSKYEELEELGIKNAKDLCFVLVAGGVGDRLGYNGIKVEIPLDLITCKTYLENYCQKILILQNKTNELNCTDVKLPLAIMTSDDTHEKTINLLKKEDYFGLDKNNVNILKQDKVPALKDNEAHFLLGDDNLLVTKPHGHGDVHMLLHKEGLVKKWKQENKKYLLFFQDTNLQLFRALPAALGVSVKEKLDMNFLTSPRRAGEAAGAITKLKNKDTSMVVNIEYNQLAPLLKETVNPKGDEADPKTGLSPYPGNLNVLLLHIDKYNDALEKNSGVISEFINPKYADEKKLKFKKPARIESMMQDIAKVMTGANIQYTNFKRLWAFSPLKNALSEAIKKFKNGLPSDSAISAENDLYALNREKLKLAGMKIQKGNTRKVNGIEFYDGAKVILNYVTLNELKENIKGGSISNKSTLVIEQNTVKLDNLTLDGTLIIQAVAGVYLTLKNVTIVNKYVKLKKLTELEMSDPDVPQYLKIRGYKIEKPEDKIYLRFLKPGKYEINQSNITEYLSD